MTGPFDPARGILLVDLPTGWQLWKIDGQAWWMRVAKIYSEAAGRVAPAFEFLGAGAPGGHA